MITLFCCPLNNKK